MLAGAVGVLLPHWAAFNICELHSYPTVDTCALQLGSAQRAYEGAIGRGQSRISHRLLKSHCSIAAVAHAFLHRIVDVFAMVGQGTHDEAPIVDYRNGGSLGMHGRSVLRWIQVLWLLTAQQVVLGPPYEQCY